jgi:hypothetical protein
MKFRLTSTAMTSAHDSAATGRAAGLFIITTIMTTTRMRGASG